MGNSRNLVIVVARCNRGCKGFVCFCSFSQFWPEIPAKKIFCFMLDILAVNCYNNPRSQTTAVERWLSWSKAHDWKSCRAPKALEGSNPSLSAIKSTNNFGCGAFLFVHCQGKKAHLVRDQPKRGAFSLSFGACLTPPYSRSRCGQAPHRHQPRGSSSRCPASSCGR